MWILHQKGKKGEWVSLNEPLKDFGITHPAELERALKYLIEEPVASVSADPDPRAKKYGEWSKEKKAAVITTEVRARLTRRGLEDMHRQKKLSSTTERKTLRLRAVGIMVAIFGVGVTVWLAFHRPSTGSQENSPPSTATTSSPGLTPNHVLVDSLPARNGHDTLKASRTPFDSSHTNPTTTDEKKNASR